MVAKLPPTIERQIHEGAAELNRDMLAKHHVFAVTIFGGPGTGKTSLLEATLKRLGSQTRIAVILGNLEAAEDARRLGKYAGCVVPVETIDLAPELLHEALSRMDLAATDILFIERAAEAPPYGLDLGQSASVGLFSVTGGDDKVRHHPERVEHADLMLLSKIDLLALVPFDMNRFHDSVRIINPTVPILHLSTITGQGMEAWCDWLVGQVDQRRSEQCHEPADGSNYYLG